MQIQPQNESFKDHQSFFSSSSESSDSENPQMNLLQKISPANELLERVYSNTIITKYIPFIKQNELPNFRENCQYEFEEPQDKQYDLNLQDYMEISKNNERLNFVKQNQESVIESRVNQTSLSKFTLMNYHNRNAKSLVYQKYSHQSLNEPTIINEQQYFSTLLCKLKQLNNDIYTNKKKSKENIDSNSSLQESDNNTLKFDSKFESGNLHAAYKVSNAEYDLVLSNDINTKGNTQWFFFSVQNVKKNQTVKFNILNLMKTDSLFNYGLCPVIYSTKQNQINKQEWIREGFDIKYFKSDIVKEQAFKQGYQNRNSNYYCLTFTLTFLHNDDTVYIAHSFPYTYTDLQRYINKVQQNTEMNKVFVKKKLCHTLQGNEVPYLTVTSAGMKGRNFRKGIIIMARQHPGESQGSYMMEGVLNFLLGNSEIAQYLRDRCVFKIIPMVNVDGVIHGNYRCSLAGCDLNRRWKKPKKKLHPEVYYLKELAKKFRQEREIKLITDLHGHSRKQNAFFYGCSYREEPIVTRIFPFMFSKLNPFIHFPSCSFNVSKDKEKTARVAL